MELWALFGLIAVAAITLCWGHFRVPKSIPRDIPRIPLYTNVLSIWWKMGNAEVYNRWMREPLEKHGAVATWFTGRWCVLVAHPELLTDLFRNDEVYPKIGVNIRAPDGTLAAFSGDNIINAGHDNWKLYNSIMKPGIVKKFDLVPIQEKAAKLAEKLTRAQSQIGPQKGTLVMPWLARYTQDVMSLCFFSLDLQALDKPLVSYEQILSKIIPSIFNRWFMHFPLLDKVGRFLEPRKSAFKNIEKFDRVLDNIMTHANRNPEKQTDVVCFRLKHALNSGQINLEQYQANLRMMFLVGHDNSEFVLISAMWELGKNTKVQDCIRREAFTISGQRSGTEIMNSLPYLTSVIYELLRLYAPVASMINHSVSQPGFLGGKIFVQPGPYLGWNSYAVHTNPQFWGQDAHEFKPERWGCTIPEIQTNVRRQTARGNYIPFSMHSRKCLGQGLALSEIKIALYELTRRIKWTVDPAYQLKMNGPMLTFPLGLKVIIRELDDLDHSSDV